MSCYGTMRVSDIILKCIIVYRLKHRTIHFATIYFCFEVALTLHISHAACVNVTPSSPTCSLQLELSWFGSDDESGIYAYEVGLSSMRSEDMDLLPYTSTHGHRHFITYHPDLMDGQTFYIHIKAVNRAGQQTVQVRCLLCLTRLGKGRQQGRTTDCPGKIFTLSHLNTPRLGTGQDNRLYR